MAASARPYQLRGGSESRKNQQLACRSRSGIAPQSCQCCSSQRRQSAVSHENPTQAAMHNANTTKAATSAAHECRSLNVGVDSICAACLTPGQEQFPSGDSQYELNCSTHSAGGKCSCSRTIHSWYDRSCCASGGNWNGDLRCSFHSQSQSRTRRARSSAMARTH